MTVDWQGLLYDVNYKTLGVDAVITPASTGQPKTMTAIEKTVGELIALGENDLSLQGIKAAAAVRMSEFLSNGLSREGIKGGTINLNDKTWKIHSSRPAPGPQGESQGELYLYLLETGP